MDFPNLHVESIPPLCGSKQPATELLQQSPLQPAEKQCEDVRLPAGPAALSLWGFVPCGRLCLPPTMITSLVRDCFAVPVRRLTPLIRSLSMLHRALRLDNLKLMSLHFARCLFLLLVAIRVDV